METMKALQLMAPRKLVMADIPRPATPSDGLLMRTRCVSVCSTDVSFFEGHLRPDAYPVILGHEYYGEVVDIGPDLRGSDVSVGDRLVYWGQTDFGGFAEYRAMRPIFSGEESEETFLAERHFYDDARAAAVRVPAEMAELEASFIEPTTGALRAVLRQPPKVGAKVLVLGSGPIGVIAGSIIGGLLAPNRVHSVDANPERNAFAARQFSHHAFLPEELRVEVDDGTYDYVFDALPPLPNVGEEDDPRRLAMRKLKPGGRYVLYGASQSMQRFDTWLMLAKGLQISSAPFDVRSFPMHETANVIAAAARMLRLGIVDGKSLLSAVCRFDDFDGLVSVLENYRRTVHMKTTVDFRL